MVAQPAHPAPRDGESAEILRALSAMNSKLDAMGAQVRHLYERTAALEELKDELVPIARDAMGALAEELQSVEHEFNSEEIAELLRKLLHSTPTLIRSLDRLESIDGLIGELEPLGKDVVRDLIDRLQELDERGYFRLLHGLTGLLDRVARHTTQEDIDRLSDNIAAMVDTFKRMTQPEGLDQINEALGAIEDARRGEVEPVGIWGLMRASREPEVQRGAGVLLAVARQMGRDAKAPTNRNESPPPNEE